ncbi:flagellin [Gammaproteobacteria bacterium]
MSSVINTNMASLYSQRNLGKSQNVLETSLQRLSSGLRINNAKDDAAGQSIAERMTSQVRGLDQAVRNANDGVSLAQTAEGGLNDVATSLQRLRELAVQSANASNTDLDRDAIQEEGDQLIAEIDRIGVQTDFNGIKLLDGSFKEQKFQVGANANQTIAVTMKSVRTADLGVVKEASVSSRQATLASTAAGVVSAYTMDKGDLIINGVQISSALGTDDHASSRAKDLSSISKAAAVNRVSDQTGVRAFVNENKALGADMTPAGAVFTGNASSTITLNGVTINLSGTGGGTAAAARQSVISVLNSYSGRTGVIAEDGGDEGGVTLKATDGRNIVVSFQSGTATSAGTGLRSGLHLGSFSLTSDKEIVLDEAEGKRIKDVGLFQGSYATQKAIVNTKVDLSTSFNAGDFKINGSVIGGTLSSYDTASSAGNTRSAISKSKAINELSSQTGVKAVVNKNIVDGAAMLSASLVGTISINGVQTASISTTNLSALQARAAVTDAINKISDRTGVTAIDTGTATYGVKLVAVDGRNIKASAATLTAAATGVNINATTHYGSFKLESGSAFTIEAGFNGDTGLDRLRVGTGTYGQGRSGETLDRLDLTSATGATKALKSLDNAISTINTQRGTLGALQNRFSSTISSLQTQSENVISARSRIQDADFAKESASMTRGQILQQAGVAMLSQANQLPQQVLQLLGG